MNNPNIKIQTIEGKKQMMEFIRMPWHIYKKNDFWVPPLIISEKSNFDRVRHPFWKGNPHQFWLALKGGKTVGRIAAFQNLNHNECFNDNMGFWGYLEAINDQEVFSALMKTAEDWLKDRGCNGAMGPVLPSIHYEMGVLIDNFQSSPLLMLRYNLPYYASKIEAEGYKKEKDFYSYLIEKESFVWNEKLTRVNDALKKRYNIKLRSIDMTRFDEEAQKLRLLYNKVFTNHWGFTPINEEEFNYLAEEMKSILDPDFLLIAEKDGEQIGFLMAYPDYNEVFKKIKNGKLYPFGFFKLLFGKKKIQGVRVYTLGLIEKYQRLGIGSIFYSEITRRIIDKGYSKVEMSWIMEDNLLMNKSAEMMGGEIYKTYRLYQKDIGTKEPESTSIT